MAFRDIGLGKTFTTITAAHAAADPGDFLRMFETAEGGYFCYGDEGTIVITKDVTIGSFQIGRRPVLNTLSGLLFDIRSSCTLQDFAILGGTRGITIGNFTVTVLIRRCEFQHATGVFINASTNTAVVNVDSCWAQGCDEGFMVAGATSTMNLRNCGTSWCDDGFIHSSGTGTCTNCFAYLNGFDNWKGTWTGSHNWGDTADTPGTNSVVNGDPADVFAAHLNTPKGATIFPFDNQPLNIAGSDLVGTGTPIDGVVLDINGNPYNKTSPSKGPFEFGLGFAERDIRTGGKLILEMS